MKMNFYPLMEKLLDEFDGYYECEKCNAVDIFYALDGTCSECHSPIHRHDEYTSFLFATTIIEHFIRTVDNRMPPLHKSVILTALTKNIDYCRKENKIVEDDEILRLQAFFANTGLMGNESEGVGITIKNSKPEVGVDFKLPEPMVRAKSFACVVHSFKYLLDIAVANEVVLRPNPNSDTVTKKQVSSRKGCLGTTVLLIIIFTITITIIFS